MRSRAEFLQRDRALAPDIAAVGELIGQGWFLDVGLQPDERPILGRRASST